jgi:hypothetical protein
VVITVPGAELERIGWDASLALAGILRRLGCRFTRVDLTRDDPRRRFTAGIAYSAMERGDYVSRCKPGEYREGRGRPGHRPKTMYWGAGDPYLLRIYDARPRHGFDATHVELQVRGARADEVTKALLAGKDADALMEDALTKVVDFRRRRGRAHGERAPQLRWWASFLKARTIPAPVLIAVINPVRTAPTPTFSPPRPGGLAVPIPVPVWTMPPRRAIPVWAYEDAAGTWRGAGT